MKKQQLTLGFVFGFLNLFTPTMAQAAEIDYLQQDSVAAFELDHAITVAPFKSSIYMKYRLPA